MNCVNSVAPYPTACLAEDGALDSEYAAVHDVLAVDVSYSMDPDEQATPKS